LGIFRLPPSLPSSLSFLSFSESGRGCPHPPEPGSHPQSLLSFFLPLPTLWCPLELQLTPTPPVTPSRSSLEATPFFFFPPSKRGKNFGLPHPPPGFLAITPSLCKRIGQPGPLASLSLAPFLDKRIAPFLPIFVRLHSDSASFFSPLAFPFLTRAILVGTGPRLLFGVLAGGTLLQLPLPQTAFFFFPFRFAGGIRPRPVSPAFPRMPFPPRWLSFFFSTMYFLFAALRDQISICFLFLHRFFGRANLAPPSYC